MNSLQLPKPHMLVVVGLPGAGKSFFAEKFGETFTAPYIDFGYFRQIAGEDAGDQLAGLSLAMLTRTKQSIVIEGRGSTREDRKDLMLAAQKKGYATLFIWVQTEPAAAEHRSVYSKTATITLDEFVEAAREFENLAPGEPYIVISGKHTYASQAKTVLKRLVTDRPTVTPVTKPTSVTITPKPATTRGRQQIPRTRGGRINIG